MLRALRAPTIATCTPGVASVQAMANWLTEMPRRSPSSVSRSTTARLRRSVSPRNADDFERQSPSSKVVSGLSRPVSRPLASGL